MKSQVYFFGALVLALTSCGKQETPAVEASLSFEFAFDPSQPRLNNLGQPAAIPSGNAAQTPKFNLMSVHYIELAPNSTTLLGKGAVVYNAPETTTGGGKAIDFQNGQKAAGGEEFTRISLKNVAPGTYEWVRASVAYQNFELTYNLLEVPNIGNLINQKGTLASFIGFNTYITKVKPSKKDLDVNGNRLQGFYAFETGLTGSLETYNRIVYGQSPAGATTVVNPLFATSPVPAGSCVVTGKLAQPLVITGNETEDIIVQLSFSTNKSLEWVDDNDNGQLDFYGNTSNPNEKIVDMGVRGMVPSIKR